MSPVAQSILHHVKYGDRFENTCILGAQRVNLAYEGKYVISVGVNHSPEDWTGPPISDLKWKEPRRSLFDDLIPKYLKDLQQKRALLLIDQTHEGYTNHLFKPCIGLNKHSFRNIIFFTKLLITSSTVQVTGSVNYSTCRNIIFLQFLMKPMP